MKRLISQFRKLPFTKRFLSEGDLPFTLFVSTVLVVVSCQLAEKQDHGPEASRAELNDVRPPLAPEPAYARGGDGDVALLAPAGTAPLLVGRLAAPDCAPGPDADKELQFKVSVQSDFGATDAALTLVQAGDKEAVRAEIEHFRLNFATSTPVKSELLKAACEAKAKGASELTLTQPQLMQLREWVLLIAPDCKILEPTAGGFGCQMETLGAAKAKEELTDIQTTMIRRWSRQPYLLARRLAIGISLASALETQKPEAELDTLCKILRASLPVELPAALSSKRWQKAACDKDNPNRVRAAGFGLAKTVNETHFMKQLFESTSRLGFLSVRVPMDSLPNKEILVSLAPESDVADNLTKETEKLTGSATACWHPAFGESTELLRLARQLSLAGEAARVACADQPENDKAIGWAERYIAESITSETEFVITNGRAKTLRLPSGSYKYTLRSLPENPDEWDDASQITAKAEGQIVWDAKRPRPVIATW